MIEVLLFNLYMGGEEMNDMLKRRFKSLAFITYEIFANFIKKEKKTNTAAEYFLRSTLGVKIIFKFYFFT